MMVHNKPGKNMLLVSWLACLFLFAAAALMPTGGPLPGSAYHLDKVVHLLVFAFLATVPLATVVNRKWMFFCTALIPIYGFVLEYMQKSIGGREFSPEDMIANNGGIVIGVALGVLIRMSKRFRKQRRMESCRK